MTSAYAARARAAAEDAQPPQLLSCRLCRASADYATVSSLGGMCLRCYDAYRSEAPAIRTPAADSSTDKRAWARALKAREEAGERLSPVQREMWRTALRVAEETTE